MKYSSIEAAISFLSKRNPLDVPQYKYATLLMDLQDNKGDDAIKGLAGFYIYAIAKIGGEKGSMAITTTFAHDLGGASDKFNLPKSSEYVQFWDEEYRKHY